MDPRGIAGHWFGPGLGLHAKPCSECARRHAGIIRDYLKRAGYIYGPYNYTVCPHGVIREMRGFGVKSGAQGTKDGNDHYYAVCYLGGTGDPFTAEAAQAFAEVRVALETLHRKPLPYRPHGSFHATACPGPAIEAWIRGEQVAPSPPPSPAPPTSVPAPAPRPPASPAGVSTNGHPTVRRGSTGDAVRLFQWKMNFTTGSRLDGDGIYGPACEEACKNFQRFFRLDVDGVCGPKTWDTLDWVYASKGGK